jgi:DNA-binding MurR/RpiR family transcriptional regulator
MTDQMMKRRTGPAGLSQEHVQGVLTKLANLRDSLPTTRQRVADYIINNPNQIVRMSVTEVAEQLQVSEATVINVCRDIQLKGFQDLKLTLARELVEPVQFIHEDVRRDDDPDTVADKIFQSNIQALLDTLKVIDRTQLRQAVDLLVNANRVEFYGIGSAVPIALDAHYRMLRIGIPCSVYTDSHVQAVSAGLTGPGVVTVTISHSGSTMETLASTRLAKEAGAKTIVITNYGKSPIQAYADVVLYTAARETQFRTEAMTSRIAELSIIDVLNTCVALATYQRAVETINYTFDILSTKRF